MQKYSVGRADETWVLKNEVSKLNRKAGCKVWRNLIYFLLEVLAFCMI